MGTGGTHALTLTGVTNTTTFVEHGPAVILDASAVEDVAVIVNNGNGGTWQYSTDSETSWQDVGPQRGD